MRVEGSCSLENYHWALYYKLNKNVSTSKRQRRQKQRKRHHHYTTASHWHETNFWYRFCKQHTFWWQTDAHVHCTVRYSSYREWRNKIQKRRQHVKLISAKCNYEVDDSCTSHQRQPTKQRSKRKDQSMENYSKKVNGICTVPNCSITWLTFRFHLPILFRFCIHTCIAHTWGVSSRLIGGARVFLQYTAKNLAP